MRLIRPCKNQRASNRRSLLVPYHELKGCALRAKLKNDVCCPTAIHLHNLPRFFVIGRKESEERVSVSFAFLEGVYFVTPRWQTAQDKFSSRVRSEAGDAAADPLGINCINRCLANRL